MECGITINVANGRRLQDRPRPLSIKVKAKGSPRAYRGWGKKHTTHNLILNNEDNMLCLLKALFCAQLMCFSDIPDQAKLTYVDITIGQETWAPSLPPGLAHAVAAAESRLDHLSISSAGAIGVFQIMPITEKHIKQTTGLSFDASFRIDNITLGLIYLEELWGKYKDIPRTLAAYNWGPGNVDKMKWDREALPRETRQYIKRIEGYMKCY